MARKIAIAIIALTMVAILVTMVSRVMSGGVSHVDVDRRVYPLMGVDVSGHNGELDFDSLAAAGVTFIYIKATEGATWRDRFFDTNYRAAKAAGLRVGIYHFFRFDVSPSLQAENILFALRGRTIHLPVAIDLEEWTNPTDITTSAVVENLRELIHQLRRHGVRPMIYTNKNGYGRFVRGNFDDVPLWICSFTNPPLPERERWTFWQHSHKGRLPGCDGPIDLSTFNTPEMGEWPAEF
ncbi:MAG: hypothetical protein K2M61_03265 [Muribaculaceae bacterium]|nr:hypothetical protein [Muribaculaceae bacterium]